MQDIKAGGADETGIGINNVELALARVDIKLRDSATSFRDMSLVLEELAGKWGSLNEVEQANLSKSIAGVRQANLFKVLMDNMTMAQKLQTDQMNASGLAADRYKIYLESVEAAQNKFTTAMQNLWQTGINSGLIKRVIDLGTSVLDFASAIGGLNTLLVITIALMVTFNYTTIMTSAAMKTILPILASFTTNIPAVITWFKTLGQILLFATSSTTGLGAALGSLGITAASLATGGLVLVVAGIGYLLYNEATRATKAVKDLKDAMTELSDAASGVASAVSKSNSIKELIAEYEKLRDTVNKTEAQAKRFTEVQNELNNLAPGVLVGQYDKDLNFLIDKQASLENIIKQQQTIIDQAKEIAELEMMQAIKKGAAAYDTNVAEAEKIKAKIDAAKKAEGLSPTALAFSTGTTNFMPPEQVASEQARLDKIIRDNQLFTNNLIDVYRKFNNNEDRKKYFESLTPRDQATITSSENARMNEVYSNMVREVYSNMVRENGNWNGIQMKQTLKPEEVDSKIEEIKGLMTATFEGAKKIQGQTVLSKEDINMLEGWGIAWDTVNGKIVITNESITTATNKTKDDNLALYQHNDALSSNTAAYADFLTKIESTTTSMYGITMANDDYKKSISDMSQTLWSYFQGNAVAMQTMGQHGIQGLEGLFNVLFKGGPEATKLLTDLSLRTKEEILAIFTTGLQQAADFSNKLTNYAPGAVNWTPFAPVISSGGGGGSAATTKSPEQTRLENEIKALENKKKSLQETLTEYNNYIEAQKQALQLQKEEKAFTDDLMKKNKSLAKLKAEIAILSLDNSEEAKAKRLKLEEEAATQEEDITKTTEERNYQVQIDALDKQKKEFEDNINAQIKRLDEKIAKYQDESKAIETTNKATGSMGATSATVYEQIMKDITTATGLTLSQKDAIGEIITKLKDEGLEAEKLVSVYNRLRSDPNAKTYIGADGKRYNMDGTLFVETYRKEKKKHETKHEGGFTGDLQSNEVFTKLLKGEYVATEGQMNNFMKNVLPRFTGTPSVSTNQSSNISISMPINVNGSLDKSVIPDIEKLTDRVVKKLNDAMKNRGYLRQTTLTSI